MFFQNLRQLPQSWRLILIFTLTAWLASLIISYQTIPIYRASATFLVFPNANITSSRDVVTSLDTLDRKTVSATYADIMNSTRVYSEAVQKLKLDPKTLIGYNRSTLVQENSNVLVLNVDGPDPENAAELANNIGQTGITYIKGIYQVFDISFLDEAVVPASPVSPQPFSDGAIWAGWGCLLGLVVALVKEQLRMPLAVLRERSIRDQISGAFTQRHFLFLLGRSLANQPDEPLSLVLIELSGLQEFVDGLPESVLSQLMRRVAAILHDQLRGNDSVGCWGKAGFALLLPFTPTGPASRTVERICSVLNTPLELDGLDGALNLAPHAGLASRNPEETLPELVRRAEKNLEDARSTDSLNTYLGGNI